MVAGSFSEHVETNTFESELHGFGKFLRTAAIYGPNAAGKTNLLLALQFMQRLILNSLEPPREIDCAFSVYAFEGIGTEAERIRNLVCSKRREI